MSTISTNPHFSERFARDISQPLSYEKGCEYYKNGRVTKMWIEDDMHKAVVRGTHPYTVMVKLSDDASQAKVSCNCPYDMGGACKHIVAAILAFAHDEKYAEIALPGSKGPRVSELHQILDKTSDVKLRAFIEVFLTHNPAYIRDLQIYIQGDEPTSTSTTDYKIKIAHKLDKLNMSDLLESWYREGEDYYDDYEDDSYGIQDALSDITDGHLEEVEKYQANDNYAEAIKICQALITALNEKKLSLRGEEEELVDCFNTTIEEMWVNYQNIAKLSIHEDIQKEITRYHCEKLGHASFEDSQTTISSGLTSMVQSEGLARYALSLLSEVLEKKVNTPSESAVIAHLYRILKEWDSFEQYSLRNLTINPVLVMGLLIYYQKIGAKAQIRDISRQTIDELSKKNHQSNSDFSSQFLTRDLEIEIRRFLKGVLSLRTEYADAIDNLEHIFLITKLIKDYQLLVKSYRDEKEKNTFLATMQRQFEKCHDIESIFLVYQVENKHDAILDLVCRYPDDDCVPDMLDHIQTTYPNESFEAYQKMIKKILIETNVDKYHEAVELLQRMQRINMTDEFTGFISWIKETYRKRRRLLEELKSISE